MRKDVARVAPSAAINAKELPTTLCRFVRCDPWALERVETYYLRSRRRFSLLSSAWFPACVRAIAVPRGLRRWFHALRG